MPKTFHMNVSFDTRIVLSDEDCAEAEKYREKCLAGAQGKQAQALAMSTHGQPLEAYIAMTLKHALRDTVADMAEENNGLMTISPAKVTQVVIPRIQEAAKCPMSACDCITSDQCVFRQPI